MSCTALRYKGSISNGASLVFIKKIKGTMIKVTNNEGTYYINEKQFSIIIDTHHVDGDRMVSCTDWRKGNQKEDHLEYCIRNVESVEVTDRIFHKVEESERRTRYMKV